MILTTAEAPKLMTPKAVTFLWKPIHKQCESISVFIWTNTRYIGMGKQENINYTHKLR